MIVAMQDMADEVQIQQVIEHLVKMGFEVHRSTGARQTVLGAVGAGIDFDIRNIELMAGVQEVHRISSPYKLAGKGFRPEGTIVKLANGDWLVGDHADRYTYDFHETEFYLADVRWIKLDIAKVQTKGTLLDKVDLSKVDEIGFVDLTPGSGHGLGGFSDVGWVEVYGKPVRRDVQVSK